MTLIKCLLFLLTVSGIEGLLKPEKWDYSSVNQRTMKTLLETCYENDSLANPIIIFGDFNEHVDKRSIIRIDSTVNVDEAYEKSQLLTAGASKVILMANSPRELVWHLLLLKKTRWWKPEIPHFIIKQSNGTCRNIADVLLKTWDMDIINSIYICAESMNLSALYTINRMANYAPHPWQPVKIRRCSGRIRYNLYRVLSTNISCEHLNFDKTKLLHNYEIKIVQPVDISSRKILWIDAIGVFNTVMHPSYKLMRSIIKTLNAQPRFELENGNVLYRFSARTADILADAHDLKWFPNMTLGQHFPHDKAFIFAVVRLKPGVSTLEKIRKLWSIEVLISAAITFVILTVVLTIINHDFSAAMLDTIRLLIYSSILTNNRSHPFRIFFTTILILMIISNGVFQGKIAAFLTTQERGSAPRTINQLIKLGYKMHAGLGPAEYVQERLPEYEINALNEDECIQSVLNNTKHVCFIEDRYYEMEYILYPLDCVEERWSEFPHFISRHNWPLGNRFNELIMRHFEAGIVNFWVANDTLQPKLKRQAMEAEWASPQYKPVRLYKLTFAFKLLAIGLTLSTFVFFLELLAAKYGIR